MIKAVKNSTNVSKGIFLIQQVRFALSGGLATALHWLVMALMINAGTTPGIATAVGAFMGAIANYFLQRNVTFQSSAGHRSALPRYIIVCILAWTANLFIFLMLHNLILITPMYAQAVTTLAVALMSYFLYKRIVFNDYQPQSV